ncbi:MAG: DUF3800 domain-containing protein [Chitinophagaceae bacterium]|jgi:hypothetical protein|nr:DUF3800 domain-containing protein [Chitinophagaceae bacterium]
MKYRIYIDEVGNSDIKSSANEDHRFLCLTGVIFRLDYVSEVLQPELEALKAKYFGSHPDDPVIFHRKELVYKKHPFQVLANPETSKAFDEEFLQLLAKWDYKVIGVVIDKQEHNNNYADTWKYDPYHYCQEILLERYKLFLNIQNASGDVMIESRGGKEDIRLKKSFRTLMDKGTNYLTAEELNERITSKELKVKAKGANVAGLQLADLIDHSVRRYAFKNILKMDDGKTTFSDAIIDVLAASKFFKYKGRIYGYGVKKLP